MELYENYIERIIYQLIILIASLCSLKIETIIIMIIFGLNIITLIYLLGIIFSGRNTKSATPVFWFVMCVFSFGICVPIFWMLQFCIRKRSYKCNINFILNVFLPLVFSVVLFFALEFWSNMGSEKHTEIACLIGMGTIVLILIVERLRKYVNPISFEKANSKIRTSKRKEGEYNEIAMNRYGRKEKMRESVGYRNLLENYYLKEEKNYNGFIEKVYVFHEEEKKVIELKSVYDRVIYAAFASCMILIMVCTPFLDWAIEHIIHIIR